MNRNEDKQMNRNENHGKDRKKYGWSSYGMWRLDKEAGMR